jgi:FecR protein
MRLRKLLSGCVLASGVAAAAAADPALVTVSGKVEIGRGTPPVWSVAQSGDALAPGDSVRTAAGARAELALGDNRIVRVYEQSVLRVGTSVTPTGAVRSVDLDEGHSIFEVMKKAVADEFDVITPEIIVSVKGTRFLVAAVDGVDYTAVFRGEVGLAGAGFEAVSVRPGMTGAHGELFLTPFGDPWSSWETGAAAPEPALDEGREREVGDAIQAAVSGKDGSGGSSGNSGSDASQDAGLLGGLLLGSDGAASAAAGAPGGPNESGLIGGTTDLLGDLLTPVTDTGGTVIAPVVDPVTDGSLLSPVGGLLSGLRSP